jgi:hypothetical protein
MGRKIKKKITLKTKTPVENKAPKRKQKEKIPTKKKTTLKRTTPVKKKAIIKKKLTIERKRAAERQITVKKKRENVSLIINKKNSIEPNPETKPNVFHTHKKGVEDLCVPLSIANALQREQRVVDVKKNPKQWGRSYDELAMICRRSGILLTNLMDKNPKWKNNPRRRLLESKAPILTIGEVYPVSKITGEILKNRKVGYHAVATKDGWLLDPDMETVVPLTKEILGEIFNGKILKVYLLTLKL